MQYNTIQNNAVQNNAIQSNPTENNEIQRLSRQPPGLSVTCSQQTLHSASSPTTTRARCAIQYNALQNNATQNDAVQYNTTQSK